MCCNKIWQQNSNCSWILNRHFPNLQKALLCCVNTEHWTENAKQKQLTVMNEKSTQGSTFLWMHNECQTVIIPCKYKLPDENSLNIKYFRMDWSRSSVENKSFVHSRRHHDVFWIESWDYLMTFRKLLKWKQRSAYEMTSKYLAKKKMFNTAKEWQSCSFKEKTSWELVNNYSN